jgi:hypothetical protein
VESVLWEFKDLKVTRVTKEILDHGVQSALSVQLDQPVQKEPLEVLTLKTERTKLVELLVLGLEILFPENRMLVL